MSQELAGKVAIITGGASGIGRATVELFVAEGANVIIADIDSAGGQALANSLGPAARFQRADVTSADDLRALVDTADREFGGLDVMYNNAGISCAPYLRFVDDELKDFQRVMEVNVLGVMLGCQVAARYMAEHGGGSIINTASMGGALPGWGVVPYRASKAAVIHFTKCAAIDFGSYGVRVNCINPGQIMTEMSPFPEPGMSEATISRIKDALVEPMTANQPLKVLGSPEDIAQAAVYLASDRSRFVTGTELNVDGGHSAGDGVNHLAAIMAARQGAIEAGD
ncbi:SDR family NAD(P)-dependent oxidoreductase [Haliea sp. E17]|uniref:SDR family NAD(P)-dependent oxidoreductase n=1 Tax=Haliea sp. E17 TaxID=3401576 RepID=UPI003AAB3B0D